MRERQQTFILGEDLVGVILAPKFIIMSIDVRRVEP